MTIPHDFEFQLGRNQALKGRGWRGLLALSLLLIALVTITARALPISLPKAAIIAALNYAGVR
jgi:hypothetical protein